MSLHATVPALTRAGTESRPPVATTRLAGLPGGRLRSIDALRGAAAVGVVLFHARDVVTMHGHGFDALLHQAFFFGRYGVWLFFVISGFCIHMRWAKEFAQRGAARVDFWLFWRRRLRRLYPPYLAALALYLLLLSLKGLQWTTHDLRNIGLNLFMLTNVDAEAASAINGVFWTLAIEEQLYLAYFLLLTWRVRFGWGMTLVCCFGARVAWFGLAFALHRLFNWHILVVQASACQWGIWALGALSVEAALGLSVIPRWCCNGWIGTAILLAAAVITNSYTFLLPPGLLNHVCWLLSDVVWGVGFFVWLNCVIAFERRWRSAEQVPRLVSWGALLGFFSYSIYLTHEVVLEHLWPLVQSHMTRIAAALPMLAGMLGLTLVSVVFARLFFQWCERPFLSSPGGAGQERLAPAVSGVGG